jgi:hypothetical protein
MVRCGVCCHKTQPLHAQAQASRQQPSCRGGGRAPRSSVGAPEKRLALAAAVLLSRTTFWACRYTMLPVPAAGGDGGVGFATREMFIFFAPPHLLSQPAPDCMTLAGAHVTAFNNAGALHPRAVQGSFRMHAPRPRDACPHQPRITCSHQPCDRLTQPPPPPHHLLSSAL